MSGANVSLQEAVSGTAHKSAASEQEAARARFGFFMLCCYLLAQAYLIPVLPYGPSWTIWPRLADFAFLGMFASLIFGFRLPKRGPNPQRSVFYLLVLVYLGCFFSYLVHVTFVGKTIAIIDGAHHLARLTEFFLLYWLAVNIPLNERRLRILSVIVDLVFVFVSIGVILTYFGIVPLGSLTAHLPQNPSISGPWAYYAHLDQFTFVESGLGTISYNHTYGAVQIIMLLALRFHLAGTRRTLVTNALFLMLGFAAVFVTESRSGLAAMIFFSVSLAIKDPKVLLLGAVIGGLLLAVLSVDLPSATLERQQTILAAASGEHLSGRPAIWRAYIKYLNEEPHRWLIGSGFGTSRTVGTGDNAHMLYLQIVAETGFVGLWLFLVLCFAVLRGLFRCESGTKPLFWVTIALLFASVTQETFYPVPSLGHFIGFYLVSLAIALRPRRKGT